MNKIIFLDIDGVLNVMRPRRDMFGNLFHRDFVRNLNHIIDETGAKIVISSSWREDGLETMQKMWKVRKLPGEVIDITPFWPTLPETKRMMDYGYRDRSCEIQEWLLTHPVETFVIIDDDHERFYKYHEDNLVVCSGPTYNMGSIEGYGLTKARANEAIRILNRQWSLKLQKVIIPPSYAREWNEFMSDFVHLYKGCTQMRDTYYRVGGFGCGINKGGYFMLLKYSEDMYDDSITTDPEKKKHLKGEWCILDKYGNERIVFPQFKTPYLISGPIYKIDRTYYNIETGEKYCEASDHIESKNYIFIENQYDNFVQNRGVLMINKNTGVSTLIQ